MEFTAVELDTFRDELLRRAVVVNAGPESVPSILEHYSWECGGRDWSCDYHVSVGGECPGGKGKPVGWFQREPMGEV